MRVSVFLSSVLLLVTFFGCKEKNGEFIERLTQEQRDAFPKDYYTLDTLHMVYSDTAMTDTFVLIGGKVEEYVARDWHAGGDDGWATSHEVIRKQFTGPDKKYSMAIRVSTSEDDDYGYPSGGGVRFTVLKRNLSFSFYDLENSTEDQRIEAYKYNWYYDSDSIVYNKISGVRKIIVKSVLNPYTLTFY